MEYGFPTLGGLISVFLFIAGIMAIFIPFWVFRIRNEVIEMNKKMDKLVTMTGHQAGVESRDMNDPGIKKCTKCGTKNRTADSTCINCGNSTFT